MAGTPEYLAPEVLQGTGYDEAVDFWTLGIFIYESVVGIPPFYSENVATMYDKIRHGILRFPPFLGLPVKELIIGLLNRDPTRRLTAPQIKRHSFFEGLNWDQVFRREEAVEWVPFTPNPMDVSNFDACFTREPVVDSCVVGSALAETADFAGFTFKRPDDAADSHTPLSNEFFEPPPDTSRSAPSSSSQHSADDEKRAGSSSDSRPAEKSSSSSSSSSSSPVSSSTSTTSTTSTTTSTTSTSTSTSTSTTSTNTATSSSHVTVPATALASSDVELVDIPFSEFPTLLDRRLASLQSEVSAVRATVIKPDPDGLWQHQHKAKVRKLNAKKQLTHRLRAFTLLDALSRSGSLPLGEPTSTSASSASSASRFSICSLHVVMVVTEVYGQSLVDTLIQQNVNPIDRMEAAATTLASVIHQVPVQTLLASRHHEFS